MMVVRSLVSIVDDDESVRESLPDLIREFGFLVRAFSSAEEFCEALTPFEPSDNTSLVKELAELVRWAADSATLAKKIEGALRDSAKMRIGTPVPARVSTPVPQQKAEKQTSPPPHLTDASVRTRDGRTFSGVPFAKLIEFIVTGELRVFTLLSITGEGHVDQPRIECGKHFVAEPQTVHHSRAKALDQNVGAPDEFAEDLLARIELQVKLHALLAAIRRGEQRIERGRGTESVTRVISDLRLFDFDVKHIPGAKNGGADALSRRGHCKGSTIETTFCYLVSTE